MGWQCKLYGHQWRHPGVYEVVITAGTTPAYPFQCARCNSEMRMDAGSAGLRPDADADTQDLSGTESELDSGTRLDE